MKKLILLFIVVVASATVACSKSGSDNPNTPRTEVPTEMQGSWMNGYFSMTEYWDQYPGDYLGNGFEAAFAFTFNADGTFTQYFSAGYVANGVQYYQQSVSKGTVEIDPATQVLKTHTTTVHYRRWEGGNKVEDRDMRKDEYDPLDAYTYTIDQDENGSDVLNLTIQGSQEGPRPFRRL